MALIKCPECSKEISSLASACPACGCPSTVWMVKDEKKFLPIFAGTTFEFGRYPYEASGELKPIKWKVWALSPKQRLAILISEYILDAKPFNDESAPVSWEDSSLCHWMNKVFFWGAFSASEQKVMLNPFSVSDKSLRVFLPDRTDAYTIFQTDESRACKVTPYAKKNGVWANSETGTGPWWLNQTFKEYAMVIDPDGVCEERKYTAMDYADIGVRPLIALSYVPDEEELDETYGCMGYVKL